MLYCLEPRARSTGAWAVPGAYSRWSWKVKSGTGGRCFSANKAMLARLFPAGGLLLNAQLPVCTATQCKHSICGFSEPALEDNPRGSPTTQLQGLCEYSHKARTIFCLSKRSSHSPCLLRAGLNQTEPNSHWAPFTILWHS